MIQVVGKKVLSDAAIMVAFFVAVYSWFSHVEMFESLVAFVDSHESWELDELIMTTLLTPLFFIWFIARRWYDERTHWRNQIQREKTFSHQLKYDKTTKLPNRHYFETKLNTQLHTLAGDEQQVNILVVEVQNLAMLETCFSEEQAQQHVYSVSHLVGGVCHEGDLIGRLGSDVFAVAYTTGSTTEADERLDWAREQLVVPAYFLALGIDFKVGVAATNSNLASQSANKLINRAASAIHSGDNDDGFYFYDEEKNRKRISDNKEREQLREAMLYNQLALHLQPQIDAVSHKVTGAEALIRWHHPVKGMIPPYAFIGLAQDNPLAIALGEWVIADALKTLIQLDNAMTISVNIFPYHIQSEGFASQLKQLLDRYPQAKPGNLKLEITELGTISDYAVVVENINLCRALGVQFSLDDFGTGHSSLNQLRILPVDEIKIDRSFVSNFLTNSNDHNMVKSVFSLADVFNIRVVSEGIETPEQRDALLALGGQFQQGYYYARPLEKNRFIEWCMRYEQARGNKLKTAFESA